MAAAYLPELAAALDALRAEGYDTRERSSGYRYYIAGLAPDSDDYGGSTEPGSEWYEECDRLLREVREIVEPHGCSAEWVNDDMVIEPPEVE